MDLKAEIKEFRKVGHEFLEGKLTVPQFKQKSGGMGVYAQRGGKRFMIRLRIPSGVLTHDAFKLAYDFAKRYQLKEIHFTTRSTIQLHELEFDDVCDIMEEAMEHGIYTRGGGGNFPRNVALSPLAGVAKDEAFDPTPYALLVNSHFMSKITTYHLPRKFKVAFSNNAKDTANCSVVDQGFIATLENGKPYFKLFIGGGLGNNPRKAIEYPELVAPEDVLYHIEAMTQVFVDHGNYENKAKARIRYIPDAMGDEEFVKVYQECFMKKKNELKLEEITPETTNEEYSVCDSGKVSDFLYEQRQDGLYTVKIHPRNGQMLLEDVEKLIAFVEECGQAQVRISMDEDLYVRNLTKQQSDQLLALTNEYNAKTIFEQSICCVGVPTCQIGIVQTREAMNHVYAFLDENKVDTSKLPKFHVSGCNNSCGRHQVGAIGLSGRRKKDGDQLVDAFELYIDGKKGEYEARMGESCGILFASKLPELICELAIQLQEKNQDFKEYIKENREDVIALMKKHTIA